jgi:hypothetical protein
LGVFGAKYMPSVEEGKNRAVLTTTADFFLNIRRKEKLPLNLAKTKNR